MPSLKPEIAQWIGQMEDSDQVIVYFAYQCLLEEVLRASAPDRGAEQAALAHALGQALVAEAKPGAGARSKESAAFAGNMFLMAAAKQAAEPLHSARVCNNLARLLGYIPNAAAVAYLAKALNDLEVREMARQALECHPSGGATDALAGALDAAGATFRVGVINSLAKRRGEKAATALRKSAADPQPEVRLAALEALADFPDPSHDAILEQATRAQSPEERRRAHVARARLAESLRGAGNRQAAERIYRAILASDTEEPQKKAARLALATGS